MSKSHDEIRAAEEARMSLVERAMASERERRSGERRAGGGVREAPAANDSSRARAVAAIERAEAGMAARRTAAEAVERELSGAVAPMAAPVAALPASTPVPAPAAIAVSPARRPPSLDSGIGRATPWSARRLLVPVASLLVGVGLGAALPGGWLTAERGAPPPAPAPSVRPALAVAGADEDIFLRLDARLPDPGPTLMSIRGKPAGVR